MKLQLPLSDIAALLGGVLAVVSFAGCASFDASNQESMLTAAGFKERTPQTAKQKELYAGAPSYKVERVAVNGKTFYAYKDEKKGTAFIGGEAEYQRYQQLAVQQRIARQNYEAAQMNREMATGWYSAYGPYAFGPYGYGPRVRMW
ncbi:conserved hypothetical protein [Chthoniobacter flavus Ellin428]|uniref:Lipoprotein n=1 Tax=Chthoniobacter flavus Ellin428 TaxID=497964 RepID=B4CYT8_9BACT|nr:hypothetical protein [Chthoniobacter flavus]EDY20629.1 conserved hypothetical protein [Chthoniobacter flavus Ellin428]TCO89864.1 hypothetical protein EV701_11236 [Chthoniobacter flavus]